LINIFLVSGLGVEDRQIGLHELPVLLGGVEPQQWSGFSLWFLKLILLNTVNPRAGISIPLPSTAFLNRRAAARYRALASIIPGRERTEETTICYKISLVQFIINLNVILYLSTRHTVFISVLMLFMIMP